MKTSQETDSLIQAYIHQHVWMLFTLLSISMGDIIYNTESGPSPDHEYTSLATHLQNQCISITTHCLQQVPDDEEGRSRSCHLRCSDTWLMILATYFPTLCIWTCLTTSTASGKKEFAPCRINIIRLPTFIHYMYTCTSSLTRIYFQCTDQKNQL